MKKRQLLPHFEAFLTHLDDWLARKPEDRQEIETHYLAGLLFMMSNGYADLGNPKRVKELLERALPILEEHYGLYHIEVAKLLINLDCAYRFLGNPNKQKELLERALVIKERHYGLNHF
ncbi:MAG: hypothetical protein PG981_000687 [Wolbachia endosymbiont of Ctenocephalides orientis wCori]|nr:MAG: hypothetical protein PG981_000687 [Wolbachia endosymbiont of Ctenocephalides orientis wCori]